MTNLMVRLHSMLRNEKGQGMVEYGLIIGLVAIVLIGALTAIAGTDDGTGLTGIFSGITAALNPAAE